MAAISVPFVKMSGAGNDFVMIDNMEQKHHFDAPNLAKSLCDRHFGIGADGLIILEPTPDRDFRMMYYNADGSYGGMCGNGGRCAAIFARRQGHCRETFAFEAVGYTYRGSMRGNRVRMRMKEPSGMVDCLVMNPAPPGMGIAAFVDTGAPHAVFFVEEVESVDVSGIGRILREHPAFAPSGANINFVQIMSPGTLRMRTYERGVEAETLACGTGSIASAVLANRLRGIQPPVTVETRSGRILMVEFEQTGSNFTNIVLEGEGSILFDGNILIDCSSTKIHCL
jgi:diaminopimelate epimerase